MRLELILRAVDVPEPMPTMSTTGRSPTSEVAVSTIDCLWTNIESDSRRAKSPINRLRKIVRRDIIASELLRVRSPGDLAGFATPGYGREVPLTAKIDIGYHPNMKREITIAPA
jgi:hypothetical protein